MRQFRKCVFKFRRWQFKFSIQW